MKNKLFERFRSKIRIKITGKNIDKFIHKLIIRKIELLDIKRVNKNTIYLWIYKDSYREIYNLKTIYDIDVVGAAGFISIRKKVSISKYLIISFILGIILLVLLTNMVFRIDVIHTNSEARNFITNELKKYGIDKYKFKKKYSDLDKIKKEILNNYKDKIEWLEIEEVGVKYVVRLQLREFADIKEETNIRDLVASKDATIKKIIAGSGQVVKEINSYVKKGDTIISGSITLNDNTKGYVSSKGKVYGEVWYNMTVEYPYVYYEEKYTGRKKNVVVFKFLDKSLELFNFNKFKNKRSEEIVLFQNKLIPIKLVYEKQKEVEIIDQVLTEKETIDKAIELARTKMEKELEQDEYIISQKNLKINIKDTKVVLEVFFVVYEDITDYKDIVLIKEEIEE